MWMPNSLQETLEMLEDLEQAYSDRSGAWILVDAMLKAHAFCALSEAQLLFPTTILERLSEIEKRLPPKCSQCNGRGSDAIAQTKCVFCNGTGCR